MDIFLGILIAVFWVIIGSLFKCYGRSTIPKNEIAFSERVNPPDSFTYTYIGQAKLSNTNKEHIQGMMQESPHMVEVEDPFPWHRFELWGRDSLADYHVQTNDCMGFSYTKVTKSYQVLPLEGKRKTQLFAFKSAEEKRRFIEEFRNTVVFEEPLKFVA